MNKLLRLPYTALSLGVALSGVRAPGHAQVVTTVRESEYRSRWNNYDVDLRRDVPLDGGPESPKPRARTSMRSFFQNGPLVLRAGLIAGWETSNEQRYTATANSKESSFYAAPALALFYDREVGSWKVSLAYSAGYVYYFTPDYIGGGKNGIQSQTAAADIQFRNSRLNLRSNTTAAFGSGYDIERGGQSDRFTFSELLGVDYQLAEFTRAGANLGFGYAFYPSAGSGPEDAQSRLSSAVFADYFWTGKTRLRLEVGAGSDTQSAGGDSVDRSYTQALVRVSYQPSGKVSMDGGLGVGYVEDSSQVEEGASGMRIIYTLAVDYAPTQKTSTRLFFGLDGTNIKPEFSLALNWHPREFTTAELSVYQRTNLSTIALAQDRTSRGVLGSVRQRLFHRFNASVSGGYEIEIVDDDQSANDDNDGFYFLSGAVSWEMTPWAMWQLESRVASRRYQSSGDDSNLQTRTALSLRLTF